MELSNSLVLIFTAVLGLILLGWFFLGRVRAVLRENRDDQSLMILQQQIEQLRTQFCHVLENNAQSIQQQLGQMLGHVSISTTQVYRRIAVPTPAVEPAASGE